MTPNMLFLIHKYSHGGPVVNREYKSEAQVFKDPFCVTILKRPFNCRVDIYSTSQFGKYRNICEKSIPLSKNYWYSNGSYDEGLVYGYNGYYCPLRDA